ncbi:hypothetical protein ARMGADRAFT_1036693 [Armillaria gallica]|uniref:Uncharacterized protein n=1 Tax=Armillaria gallica TaxID=47427 RepID=A0A2H3CPI8_ARMGA|nr:hypothetical protein ARMGADRAFT_1036693 [Armillaria gallica]
MAWQISVIESKNQVTAAISLGQSPVLRISLEPVENVKPSPGVLQTWNKEYLWEGGRTILAKAKTIEQEERWLKIKMTQQCHSGPKLGRDYTEKAEFQGKNMLSWWYEGVLHRWINKSKDDSEESKEQPQHQAGTKHQDMPSVLLGDDHGGRVPRHTQSDSLGVHGAGPSARTE